MSIFIRKATASDYDALCELFDEVDALHRQHLPEMFQRPDGPVRTIDYFREVIADENSALFIAETDDTAVGFVHAVLRDAPPVPVFVPRRFAVVDNLGVKAGYRQQGIGRMLMETINQWAGAQRAKSIELNVYDFNQSAIAFYQALGYKAYSRKMSRDLDS